MRPEEKDEADHGHDPGEGVKDPVPKHVDFKVADGVFGKPGGQHGVNLEDLMKKDAVHEIAESDPRKMPTRVADDTY